MATLIANPYLVENDGSKDAIGGQQVFSVAAGASSGVLISVPTMRAGDKIQSVIEYTSGVPSDKTLNVTSVSASGFKMSSVSSDDTLVVVWLDRKQGD